MTILPPNYSNNAHNGQVLNSKELSRQNRNRTQSQKKQMNKTLEGVVVNNFIKDENKPVVSLNMDDICDTLIIPDTFDRHPILENSKNDGKTVKPSSMLSRALPLIGASGAILGGILGLTALIKKSAASLNDKSILKAQRLPSLGMNMNIKQEHEFGVYMALRNPNKKSILAMLGIFIVSGITLVGKNLIDGIKEIWVEKRKADAQKYLEDSLIDIETRAFAGKLDVIREELVDKANYFKGVLGTSDDPSKAAEKISVPPDTPFARIFGFKGKKTSLDTSFKEQPAEPSKKDPKNSSLLLVGLTGLTLLAGILMGRKMFKNIVAADSEIRKYVANEGAEIDKKITALSNKIKNAAENDDITGSISQIKELLKIKRADSVEVENTLGALNRLSDTDIEKSKMEVMTGIKSIYGDAPEAIGGKVGQIQYYCYLDETRGHIYNWIMNPDNPFAAYLFMALAVVNSAGYSISTAVNGIQEAAVNWEKKKTERDLQERLVDTEIRNFKSKKQSAVAPLMIEFNNKLNNGASKEELKTVADNILLEIKNGPPFVYA